MIQKSAFLVISVFVQSCRNFTLLVTIQFGLFRVIQDAKITKFSQNSQFFKHLLYLYPRFPTLALYPVCCKFTTSCGRVYRGYSCHFHTFFEFVSRDCNLETQNMAQFRATASGYLVKTFTARL